MVMGIGNDTVKNYGPAEALLKHVQHITTCLDGFYEIRYGKAPTIRDRIPFIGQHFPTSKEELKKFNPTSGVPLSDVEKLQQYIDLDFITEDNKKILQTYIDIVSKPKPKSLNPFFKPNYDLDPDIIAIANFADETFKKRLEEGKEKANELREKDLAGGELGDDEDGKWRGKENDRKDHRMEPRDREI